MTKAPPRKSTLPAKKSAEAMEFRKTNEAIGLRLREGKLTLLPRKLFNVMVYKAQNTTLGANAPIETEVNSKYYWIPLSDVARDASYDSKDTELLKHQLDEMLNIKVVREDEHEWTSERLIASIKFVNPEGLKKHGGVVWLGYAFPPEVHDLVTNPATYTKLSIYYQGMLRSGPALALYEICRRYATNPSHLTSVNDYNYWHGVLTGNPITEDPPEYKYFKRDVLKPAISEVNSMTDIEVELIEHKVGRKVQRLQFSVHLTRQPSLEFPPPPVIDSELIGKLQALGFSAGDAQDICGAHSEEKIQQTLQIVQERMRAKGAAPLDAPAAYFRWALKNAQASAITQALPEASRAKPKAQGGRSSVLESFLTARAADAVAAYKELPAQEADAVMRRFKLSPAAKDIRSSKGLDSPMTRSLFGRWYAQELWGEPTAQALDAYLQQNTIPAEGG